MKKISLLCATALLCSALGSPIYAEAVFKVNDVPYENGDAICMNHDNGDLISVTYLKSALIWDNAANFSAHWGAIGDLELVSETDSTATFRSTNLGKGVARLYYNSGCCGAAVDLHIYKEFAPEAHNLEIEGPTCLTPGETVVFSVRPVLTRNLNAYIGVDSYYWNLTDTGINKPSFVDRIVYAAGDGSSVTFVASTVHAGDEVRVNFGQCNRDTAKTISKLLGKLPPAPQVANATLCVPYGGAPIENIRVLNPVDSVEYTCEVPSQYTASRIGSSGHVFTVKFDAASANDIKIRANYIGEEACGSSETTIHVVRTWGSNVSLVYQDAPQEDCCAKIGGGSHTFAVSGDIPQNSTIYWQLPTGWEYDSNYSEGQEIHIYPTASALAMDTLRVWGDACNDENVVVKTLQVYVKPASVASIEHPACVSAGDSVMFRAVLANNGVAPVRYHWSTSDNINLDMFTGDSVIFAPTSATTTVSVQPMGAVCAGDTCTDTLSFVPIAPTGIVVDKTCIAAGMPDTIMLSVVNPLSVQTYYWTISDSLSNTTTAQGTQIAISTLGISGRYPVSVYAKSMGECEDSPIYTDTISIPSHRLNLEYEEDYVTIYKITGGDKFNISETAWRLFEDGIEVDPALYLDDASKRELDFIEEYVLGDIANSIHYTIVADITMNSGCKVRLVYGAPMNTDNLEFYQERQMKKALSTTNKLDVYPNPTSSELTIAMQNQEAKKMNVRIYDMEGTKVKSIYSYRMGETINISDLPKGVYFMHLSIDGQILTKEIIKQ